MSGVVSDTISVISDTSCFGERLHKSWVGLPNNKILDQSKFKVFAVKINVTKKKKNENFSVKGRKRCGKRRKCWLLAFSPFPTMFSKGVFGRVIKSRVCVVKS